VGRGWFLRHHPWSAVCDIWHPISSSECAAAQLALQHLYQHIVASIGAFLTVAALAIDPFAQQVTSATSLPATPPYRPPFWCSYCAHLLSQQPHLEDAGFKTSHIDSLYTWLFFYVIDQRPIRQNVYITRGFFRGVPSYLEDLGRIPGTLIILFS
jgi:hypothetical protein